MSERKIFCKKLGKEAPGLENMPFDDELGHEIFENISKEVWSQWTDQLMVRVINEYRLNLADPEHYSGKSVGILRPLKSQPVLSGP